MASNLIAKPPHPDQRPGQNLRLAALAPHFEENPHRLYYDLLTRALADDRVYNIALTGAYGTGKSSVLSELRRAMKTKVVQLSLSTTAPNGRLNAARIEDEADFGPESRTNQIQKEIVKQLLYRLPTRKLPRSKFRRTSKPDRGREWVYAVLWGSSVFASLLVLGLAQSVIGGNIEEAWRQAAAYVLLLAASIGGAWMAVSLVRRRSMVAASVTAGPATVTLTNSSDTYFDEYLDEIVYFFQASKYEIVLVEDIDRFDDVQVFDTLRALNNLLNASHQIDRRIVFVYAIRDSVFEQIGAQVSSPDGPAPVPARIDRAKAMLERASRTKFFDVIIPVVSFVSADNARDVMSKAMKSTDFEINPGLIRLAARHVADMRTIHNIRNEFEVYRTRLVIPDGRVPGVTDDLVFAMVLYKNTHLADFEKIRHRDSTLDQLYLKWRELVRINLAVDTERLAELRQDRYLEGTADSRATDLGRRLLEFCGTLHEAARATSPRATVQLAGVATEDNASSRETWAAITSGTAQQIAISDPRYSPITLSFSADQLAKLLDTRLDGVEWVAADLTKVEREIAETEDRIEFLKHHTWAQLCGSSDIALPRPRAATGATASKTAAKEAPEDETNELVSFNDLVEELLESDLARELVRHDFLTSHFALYASSYYGEHLGREAMEYIRRCIEPGTPDASYMLSEEDVIQILREQGAETADNADLFDDASIHNVSILNYLLKYRPEAGNTVAFRLSRRGEQDCDFLDTYVAQGALPDLLLAAMTPHWSGIVTYVASAPEVDSPARLALLDAVLGALPSPEYEFDDEVRQIVTSDYAHLNAITHPASPTRAGVVLQFAAAAGASLESLEPLNSEARGAAVDLRLYPVTAENLLLLTPGDSLALNALRKRRPVYDYVIDRLGDYLTAFDASSTAHTVDDPDVFTEILNESSKKADVNLIGRLIKSASPACRVTSLTQAPEETWPFLAAGDRIDPTFPNTKGYIYEYGVDEHFGPLLARHEAITESGDVPQEDRREIAVDILAASQHIPDVVARVRLAKSLTPGEIPPGSIQPEKGPLVANLLTAHLVADDAAAFSNHLMVDWSTFEAAISASGQFATFVSTEVLGIDQIPNLLRSTAISTEVKKVVVNGLAAYLVGATNRQVEAAAKALNERGWEVRYARIEALRAAGASNGELVKLIAREGNELATDDLKALLRAMKEPYSKVADRGRGRPHFPDDQAHRDVLDRLVGDTIRKAESSVFKGMGRRLVAHSIHTKG